MNIKCDVIVDELFIQVVWIVLFTQTMPAIKFYPVQVFVSNKISG